MTPEPAAVPTPQPLRRLPTAEQAHLAGGRRQGGDRVNAIIKLRQLARRIDTKAPAQ